MLRLDQPWETVALVVVAYLIGSLPLGFWMTRWRRWGLDIRRYGSGNVGTSNIFRHAGFGLAAVVGPLQFAQGLVPVLLASALGLDDTGRVLAGVAAIVGNGWSVWLGFEGGRAVAVSTGVVAGLSLPALGALLVFYALGALRGAIAEGVLLAYVALPLVMLALRRPVLAVGAVAILLLLLARRLEGCVADMHRFGSPRTIVRERLLHDRRPGRPLVGHRADLELQHQR